MTALESAPDLIGTLYAAALRMERAAADARAVAEQLAIGAAEARRAYEVASLTIDETRIGRDLHGT